MKLKLCRINQAALAKHSLTIEELQQAAQSLIVGPPSAAMVMAVGDNSLFLKRYRFPRLRDKLRLRLGYNPAARAYEYARRLQEMGVPCATPLAVFASSSAAVLITEALCEGGMLRDLFKRLFADAVSPTLAQPRTALLRELAGFLYQLHEKGIYHSDLHDANIWVQHSDDNYAFALLDLEAIRFCRRVSIRRKLKNLLRLARNLGTAAAEAGVDGVPVALELADCYFSVSSLPVGESDIERVKAAARRGRERWRETHRAN